MKLAAIAPVFLCLLVCLLTTGLESAKAQDVGAGLCPAQCGAGRPAKTPFGFGAKASQFGDPNGGGPLGAGILIPGTMDSDAPTKRVRSQEYFGKLDGFEAWSAKECGVGLMDPGTVQVAAPCNNAAMNARYQSITSSAHQKSGSAPPSTTVIDSAYDQQKSPAVVAEIEKALWIRTDGLYVKQIYCRPKDFTIGNADLFGVFVSGEMCSELTASRIPGGSAAMQGAPVDTRTNLHGGGRTGVHIFGKAITVIEAKKTLESPYKKDVTRKMDGYLFGVEIFNEVQTGKDIKFDKNHVFGTIDKSVSKTFTVGPVPITVEGGVSGSAGVVLMSRQTSTWANGRVAPYVDSVAYARGFVNAVIAQAGVEASLNPLFKDVIDIYGASVLSIYKERGTNYYQFIYSSQLTGTNKIEALSGKVDLFAKIVWPKFIGWKWKRYNVNLFSWTGVKDQGYFFSHANMNQPIRNLANAWP